MSGRRSLFGRICAALVSRDLFRERRRHERALKDLLLFLYTRQRYLGDDTLKVFSEKAERERRYLEEWPFDYLLAVTTAEESPTLTLLTEQLCKRVVWAAEALERSIVSTRLAIASLIERWRKWRTGEWEREREEMLRWAWGPPPEVQQEIEAIARGPSASNQSQPADAASKLKTGGKETA